MQKPMGDVTIDPTALTTMQQRSGTWAAYQNHALDSIDCGRLEFLQVGEGCTIKEAPEQMPDSHLGIGWRYRHIGYVDLQTGTIVAEKPA